MEEIYIEIIRHIGIAIGVPILIGFFRILTPLKSEYKVVPVDPIEGKVLENKRNLGCVFNLILTTVLLSFSAPFIWKPLYLWLHHYPNALFVESLDNITIYMLCAYLAAPISIISTNYWFAQQYGSEKFNLLQNHYTAMYKFNNPNAEKFLFYASLILAVFIVYIVYSPATFVTENEIYYNEGLSINLEKKEIKEIKQIDYIKNVIYDEAKGCTGWPQYRIIFNDNSKFYSRDINDYTSENNVITHQMYQYISQKSGKPIIKLDCITLKEFQNE